jgi:hypothetical protein
MSNFDRLSKKQQANKQRVWELERMLDKNIIEISDIVMESVLSKAMEREDMQRELDEIENQVPESVQGTWDDVYPDGLSAEQALRRQLDNREIEGTKEYREKQAREFLKVVFEQLGFSVR